MVHDDENESEEKEEKDETKEKTVAKDTKESKAESNVAKKDSSPKKAFSPCAFFATLCNTLPILFTSQLCRLPRLPTRSGTWIQVSWALLSFKA